MYQVVKTGKLNQCTKPILCRNRERSCTIRMITQTLISRQNVLTITDKLGLMIVKRHQMIFADH